MHATAAPPITTRAQAAGSRPLAGFGDLLRSEFFKLRSVRSPCGRCWRP